MAPPWIHNAAGHARFEASEVGLRRGAKGGEVCLCGELVAIGGGGLAQRFGVRFGLAAIDAGGFKGAGRGERVEGACGHGLFFRRGRNRR